MEFFFPDSQDQVSLLYNFDTEEHAVHRVRQRDDLYAHEILRRIPYDGMLISKAIVDGGPENAAKYTEAQRQRIYRLGVHQFFRADTDPKPLCIMGDCGAFSYFTEDVPPYTVDEVIDFYEGLGLDRGVSVDHIVFGYQNAKTRAAGAEVDPEWIRRRNLTIQLAAEFHTRVRERNCSFAPVGVAHGWDPASYQLSVQELQKIGYSRIALGGMVPLKTPDLLEAVEAVSEVRDSKTQFHLLGVTRTEHMTSFAKFGVTSFDSTSPFRQAFMDDSDNYYAPERTFMALRIPQVDGNPTMKKRIAAGLINQRVAITLERRCLEVLRGYEAGSFTSEECVVALREYERLYDDKKDRSETYREFLEAAPWRSCTCGICDVVGIEVAIFRGSERNKRRGFHNLAVFLNAINQQRDVPLARSAKKRT
jgi:hypothetical protein